MLETGIRYASSPKTVRIAAVSVGSLSGVLLPWAFVILMENGAKRISALEWAAYATAVVVNAYATYLFHFTEFIARN